MSAAAPAPPPHLTPPLPPAGARRQPANGGSSGGQPTAYPHVQDLIERAERQIEPQAPIARLLDRASNALKQSQFFEDYGKLDHAFVELYVATKIVTSIIPKHKDLPHLKSQTGRLATIYGQCIQGTKAEIGRLERLKERIGADNARSGVKRAESKEQSASHDVASSTTAPNGSSSHQSDNRPVSVHEHELTNGVAILGSTAHRNSIAVPASLSGNFGPRESRRKPPVQPKPQNLHGAAVSSNGTKPQSNSSSSGTGDLNERFSQLGSATASSDPRADDFRADQYQRPDSRGSGSFAQRAAYHPSPRPTSPPSRKPYSPAPLASIVNGRNYPSLNSNLSKELPKQPSPTYSPSRTTHDANGIHNHPNSEREILSANDGSSSLASMMPTPYQTSPTSYHAPVPDKNEAFPDDIAASRRRRRNSSVALETEISAERLYDYLVTFSVLLLDVRNREEYDSGHIFSQSVVCIEPASLRRNMSAEELLETLVLSPEAEYDLFDRRNEFDLVVYYDQSTASTDFLKGLPGTNPSLKVLHDTLHDFNQEKPLHFPPILLRGGMDAWIDLLGSQALQMSNTVALRPKDSQPRRPGVRRPSLSQANRLNIHKKRYREYNPIAPEEEMQWRERARSESIVNVQPPLTEEDEAAHQQDSEQLAKVESVDYDDFNRRYPDVSPVEEEQSLPRPPSRPPPEVPRIPDYPQLPVPSVPSRPPPAVPRPSYSGVSERLSSQNVPVSKSSQLAPYIPPKLMRLPRTGLHNFGVTCYMNSTIQALSATIPLTAFFFDGQYKRYTQSDNWKGSKGLMPELYNTLLQNLWRANDNDTLRPTNFRKFCARLNREWGIDRQQDAKEFLEFLIDTLHEDFNVNWARTPLRALTPAEEAAREQTPPFYAAKCEWERYLHRDNSRLTDLFAGQHISRLQCTTCRHSSTTYEAFYSISVEIPSPSSKSKTIDIHDCLRSYCSAETLSGDEVWRCPHCKKEREATKRITITRVPQFLVVHFKRFSASHTQRVKKVHTPVEFPLNGLDLSPYVLPPPDQPSRDYMEKRWGPQALDAPQSMKAPYVYDAYAVIRHLGGTMASGHYISLVEDKARGCWREFNDDRVTDFQPQQLAPSRRLQNEQAYIVFYQRAQ